MATSAEAQCEFRGTADKLRDAVVAMSWGRGALTTASHRELDQTLERVTAYGPGDGLSGPQMDTVHTLAVELRQRADLILETGSREATERLARDLIELGDRLRVICGPAHATIRNASDQSGGPVFGQQDVTDGLFIRQENVGLLTIVISGGLLSLAALYTIRMRILFAQGRKLHRRSCEVESRLWIGNQLFCGDIKAISRQGCRFSLHNVREQQVLRRSVGEADAAVVAAGQVIPCDVWRADGTSVIILFELEMSVEAIDRILAGSSIEPRLKRWKPLPPRNVPSREKTRKPMAAFSAETVRSDHVFAGVS